MKSAAWKASPPEEQMRRGLYLYSKRGLLLPMMTTFNFMDATQSCGQRDVTTVPTQALVLLNNPFVHDRSDMLARTIISDSLSPSDQVQNLWSTVYGRSATELELNLAVKHLSIQSERLQQQSRSASAAEETSVRSAAESALASLAHVLLNSNEFIYVD